MREEENGIVPGTVLCRALVLMLYLSTSKYVSTDGWKEHCYSEIIVEPGRGQQMPIVYMQQGHYVSLSGDYLALGTLEGDKIEASGTASKMNLITQVYKWGENGWMKLGNTMDKGFYFDESVRDQWPLKPVVIKGSILAIGSKSSVDVYSWNEAAWEWKPREIVLKDSEIDGLLG